MFHSNNNPSLPAMPIQEMFNQLMQPTFYSQGASDFSGHLSKLFPAPNEPSTSRVGHQTNGNHLAQQGPLEVKQQIQLSHIRSVEELEELFPTDCSLYKQLIEEGYFNHRSICVKCGKDMTLRRRGDSHEWRCRKERKRDCSSKSIKKTSWFDRTAVKTREILKLTILWINRCPSHQISQALGLSSTTTVDYKNFLREICVKTADTYDQIGGLGKEVDIGLTNVVARRCNKQDSPKEMHKVIGGAQRGSNLCFAFEIDNMTTIDILKKLSEKVHPASIVHSELYKIYPELLNVFPNNGLAQPRFYGNQMSATSHFTVESSEKHSLQVLENLWDRMKQPLKDANGASESLIASYLAEFIVREKEGENFPYVIFEYIRKFRKQ